MTVRQCNIGATLYIAGCAGLILISFHRDAVASWLHATFGGGL